VVGVGLIGFGRVGRRLLRELESRQGQVRVVRIAEANPHGRPAAELAANFAYLLAHDSTAGPFPAPVAAQDRALSVDGRLIPMDFGGDPANVDWQGVDILVEASGDPTAASRAAALAGEQVKKVVITRSVQHAQVTLIRGVNFHLYDPERHHVISCSTCTANATAPVLKLLDQAYGIERGSLITVHPALSGDTLLDAPAGFFCTGRSGLTIRPVPSQVAHTTSQVLPQLQGRLMAMSLRVPTPVVNALCADLVLARPPAHAREVGRLLQQAAQEELAGILRLEEGFLGHPKPACDFAADPHSAIVDLHWLSLSGSLLRLLIWHDNEYAYCCRVADTLEMIAAKLQP
jgi:glyceraldehyde 3-phosphate dehydrogenase